MLFPQSTLKDVLQELWWLIGSVGGLIAASIAIYQMMQSRRQRHQELRWKRAGAARELVKDIHNDDHAKYAVMMMDWYLGKHVYTTKEGKEIEIAYDDVLTTLAKSEYECAGPTEVFIYDSFDWFFYFLNRIEHSIRTGYVDFEDVETIFIPYVRLYTSKREVYHKFVESRDYSLVDPFMTRYAQNLKARSHQQEPDAA